MKHTFLLLTLLAAMAANATTVSVKNQKMVLNQNGTETVLTPNGADESYYWVSLSPDGQRILYTTAHHGTFVCNLEGEIEASLGHLNAPKWADNNEVYGMVEHYQGHDEVAYTDFYGVPLNTLQRRVLKADEQARFLSMEAERQTAYRVEAAARTARRTQDAAHTVGLAGLKIYLNPGHGGYDANDRSCWTIPVPETWSNPAGYWESKSNLVKGLALKAMLEAAGANVIISRTTNNSGIRDLSYYPNASDAERAAIMAGDDRDLSAIAEEANANQVDHFLSIHSNALNTQTNYLLELYHGENGKPTVATSDAMAASSGNIQIQNPLTVWTSSAPMLRGDITFYGDSPNDPLAGLGVLRPLTVPGFLSEGSFHDYPPETHRLMNEDYCKLEALRMFQHFHRFYNRELPQTATISGWVKSENEKVDVLGKPQFTYVPGSDDQWLPLNGAKVVLINSANERVDSLVTDGWYNGIFAFYDLTPGTYTVETSLQNYKTIRTTVTVAAEEIAGVKVRMPNMRLDADDYADPEQDPGTMAMTSYDLENDGAAVTSASAYVRVIYKNGVAFTLSANGELNKCDFYLANPTAVAVPAGVTLADIAFTADGYLVASAVANDALSVYTWDEDFTNPTLLFTKTGVTGQAGASLAVTGPRWNSEYFTEVGGSLVGVTYNEDTPAAQTVRTVKTVAANDRLMIAPDEDVFAGANMMPAFFRYAGQSYMAMPAVDNGTVVLQLFDVTAGLAQPVAASPVYSTGLAGTTATALAYVSGYEMHINVVVDGAGMQAFKSISTPVANIYAGEVKYENNTFSFRLNENATSVVIAIEKEGEILESHNMGALEKGAHSTTNPFTATDFDAYSITASSRAVAYPAKISTDEPLFQFYAPRGVAVDKCETSPFFGRVYVSESLGGQITAGTPEVARATTTGMYALSADFTDITNQGANAWNGGVQWGDNNAGSNYQFALARPNVAPDGRVLVTSTAFASSNVYIMDPANPAAAFQPVFKGSRKKDTGAIKKSTKLIANPPMHCLVLGTGKDAVLYTYDRDNSLGTVYGNILSYKIGELDSLPWTEPYSEKIFDDMTTGSHMQNASGQIAYDGDGGFFLSQYRYNSSAAVPALIHVYDGEVNYNCSSDIPTCQQGGMAVNKDGSLLAIARELGTVAVYEVTYNNHMPALTEKYVIDWGAGKGNTMGVDFDAAGNLYIVSNSNERLMVYALPNNHNSYTTRIVLPKSNVEDALEATEAWQGVEKIVRDGQVFIRKNGKLYTVLGVTAE